MRISLLVLLAAFVVSMSACHSQKPSKMTANTADSIAKITDPSARIFALNKYINASPGTANLYILRSKAYDESGALDSALKDAKTAIGKDSTQADWFYYMSDLFMEKPSVKNAINILERLAVSQPLNKEVYTRLAELDIKSGNTEECMKNVLAALKIDPNDAKAYFWLGYDYREMKQNDKAILAFQKVAELKPDDEDAYVILGLLYKDKKDPKAEEYFKSAIRLNAHDTAAIFDLGKYYQDRDSFQRAIDQYQKILALNPDFRNANYGIGDCLYHLGKYDDAIGYFSKVLLNNPKDPYAHLGRSLCFKEMKQYDKARKENAIADQLFESQGVNQQKGKK